MELANMTIREIAVEITAATRVFEDLKIVYCCGGNINSEDACNNACVSPDVVEAEISTVLNGAKEKPKNDFGEKIPNARLIDLIVEENHKFTRDEIL
ncbi:MAG: DUF542 domain-containing protein [Pyrinomonadaceae bacterium]